MELQMLGFSATITTSLPPPPAICEGTVRDFLYEREKEDEKEEDEMEDGHHWCGKFGSSVTAASCPKSQPGGGPS